MSSLHADDVYDRFLFLLSPSWSWSTQCVVHVCEWGCKLRASLMVSQSVCRPRTDSVMSSCVITQHTNRNSISSPRLWWCRGRPVCSDRSVSAHCSTVCSKNWRTVGIHTVLVCVCERPCFSTQQHAHKYHIKKSTTLAHLVFLRGKKLSKHQSRSVCVAHQPAGITAASGRGVQNHLHHHQNTKTTTMKQNNSSPALRVIR